jgi:glycopeptide antibiotics resistance protein
VLDVTIKKIFRVTLLIYIIYLIFLTLSPFRLRPLEQHHFPWPIGPMRSDNFDVVANVFLFIPLGFLLAQLFPKKGFRHNLLYATAIAAGASLTIETVQIVIQGRFPSFIDLFTNATGGGIGFIVGNPLEEKINLFYARFNRQTGFKYHRSFLGLLLIYSALLFYLPFFAPEPFSNWSPNVQLLIGNNPEQEHPWKGGLLSLALYDHALSYDQVKGHYQDGLSRFSQNAMQENPVALYLFEKKQGVLSDRSPIKPPLDLAQIPQAGTGRVDHAGVIMDGSTVLESSQDESKLYDRVRSTKQLTMEAWVHIERQFDTGGRFLSFVKEDQSLFYFYQDIDEIVLAVNAGFLTKGRFHSEGIETALAGATPISPSAKPVHLVGTYRSEGLSLYFNGKRVARGSLTDGFFVLANYLNLDRIPFGGRGLLGLLLFWPFGLFLSLTLREVSLGHLALYALMGSLFVGLILFIEVTQHSLPFFTQRTSWVPVFASILGIISGEMIKKR